MENKGDNSIKYDFVEATPSRKARDSFYKGLKNLEKGDFIEAEQCFSRYGLEAEDAYLKKGDFKSKPEIPSFFKRQIIEGHLNNTLNNIDKGDFYNAHEDLFWAEGYLKY